MTPFVLTVFALSIVLSPRIAATKPLEARHVPLFYLHPDERFFPMSPENFLAAARLMDGRDLRALSREEIRALAPSEALSARAHALRPVPGDLDALFWQEGSTPLLGVLPEPDHWRLIEYWIHLPHSSVGLWGGLGDHEGDWEGVALLFRAEKPIALYVSQHNGGQWLCRSDLEWSDDRPVFYLAQGTHASYARPGRQPRNGIGIADDLTSRGPLFDGGPALRSLTAQPFAEFQGHWGAWSWLSWNRGPRVPFPGRKFLPRETAPAALHAMTKELHRCD